MLHGRACRADRMEQERCIRAGLEVAMRLCVDSAQLSKVYIGVPARWPHVDDAAAQWLNYTRRSFSTVHTRQRK